MLCSFRILGRVAQEYCPARFGHGALVAVGRWGLSGSARSAIKWLFDSEPHSLPQGVNDCFGAAISGSSPTAVGRPLTDWPVLPVWTTRSGTSRLPTSGSKFVVPCFARFIGAEVAATVGASWCR